MNAAPATKRGQRPQQQFVQRVFRYGYFAVIYVLIKWSLILLGAYGLHKAGLWHPTFLLVIPLMALTVVFFRHRRKKS